MSLPAVQSFQLVESQAGPNHRALAALWAQDLNHRVLAGELSARTRAAYCRGAAAWLDWLDRLAVAMPSPVHVQAYVGHLRGHLRPGSVNQSLAAVRAFYAWAETRNAYPSIARSVKALKDTRTEPLDCLNRGQVAGLLHLVDGDSVAALRDRALVHVLFSTALRLVSVTGANVEDLVEGQLAYQGKGDRSKRRLAFFSPSALAAVNAYLEARQSLEGPLAQDAPLFAAVGNRAGGGRLTDRSVRRVLVGLMERAGHVARNVDGHLVRPRVLSAHSLRRSGITAAVELAGMEAGQALAGHADMATTARFYARVDKGRKLRLLAQGMDLGAQL